MGNSKTVLKFFTLPQYRKEENFLSDMNEKGWRFTHVTFPGFYHFEKSEPEQFSYRIDYNQEGRQNKTEYVKLFSDCGWEYICDFAGFSYFRKEGIAGEEREEIFCDESSRLDMMKRFFRGKIYLVIILFALLIIPQLLMNTLGSSVGGYGALIVTEIISFIFLGLAILYLIVFSITAVHFYKYEKLVSEDNSGLRLKYAGYFAIIGAMMALIGFLFWFTYLWSSYTVTEIDYGYVVDIEKLNTSVVKEYDLKKGDIVEFHIVEYKRGYLHLSITERENEPVFFCDAYNWGYYAYTIQNDGRYLIEISGKRAIGNVEVTIVK